MASRPTIDDMFRVPEISRDLLASERLPPVSWPTGRVLRLCVRASGERVVLIPIFFHAFFLFPTPMILPHFERILCILPIQI